MNEEDFTIVHEYIPEREIARLPEGLQVMRMTNEQITQLGPESPVLLRRG